MRRGRYGTIAAILLLTAVVAAPSAAAAGPTVEDVVIAGHDGTPLALTVYRPAGASRADPVPMIVHSHGWAGTRTSAPDAFAAELDRGFGVVSLDQRGHGDSGGQAHIQDPEREGRDVLAVLDFVTGLDWVRRDVDADGVPDPDDPAVVGMGYSYGGAFQLVGALTETAATGATRFDALAPEITWFDLSQSLAPQGVVRSAWAAVLYATGAGALPEPIHRGFLWGVVTGQWPDGATAAVPDLAAQFAANGPSGFVDRGVRLDVPALVGQATTDNLFNLNQGWHNFERTLTDAARDASVFVGATGGHALPSVLPAGRPPSLGLGATDDACTPEGFAALRLDFYEAVLDGADPRALVGGLPYHLTTADGGCVRVDALDARTRLAGGVDVALEVAAPATGPGHDHAGALADRAGLRLAADASGLLGDVATTTGVGVPIHLELAEGPLTVAGVPELAAEVTTVGYEQRLFAALAVGTSPTDATIVQNNMLPLREPAPVRGQPRVLELPGVAVEVADDERLYLTLSALSDTSFAHGSVRTPGVVRLDDLRVDVPLAAPGGGVGR